MIVVDTSALIDSLSGPRHSADRLRDLIGQGERLVLPALVLYEWRRGPRLKEELAAQGALLPSESALTFGPAEATIAASLYRQLSRPRGREIDLAIAAHALVLDADLWTLNVADFADVPELRLVPS
ncbi:MAG TPA: type II toxin-antitoxin system VapC family toxin [Thermoanaerobaculia bacterium]|nr:type II toxin-antitoxin system VapC family toxin [Thermoanaerobaculia bacterium]